MAENNMVSVLSDLGFSVSEFPPDVNASSVPYGLKQTPDESSSPVDEEEANDGMSFPLSSLDPPLPPDHAEDRKSGSVQYVNDGDAAYNGLDLHFSLAAKEAENSNPAQNGRQDHIVHEEKAEGDDTDLTSHCFQLAHQRSEYEFSISDLVAQATADIAACPSTDQPVSVSLHLSSAAESVPLPPPSPNNLAPEISQASIVQGGLDHNTHVESPQVAIMSLDDHTDSVKESDAALPNDSIMEDLSASEVALHPDHSVVEPNVPDHAVVKPNSPLLSDGIMEDLPESEPAAHPDDVVETKAPFPSEETMSDASEGSKGSLPSTPVVPASEQPADAVVLSADTCPEPAPSLQFHSLVPGITDMPNSTTVTVKGSAEEGSFQFSSLNVQTAAMESKVLLLFSQTPDPKPDASNMKQGENVPPSHIPPLALNLQLEPSIDTKEKSGTTFRGQLNVVPEVLESQARIEKPQMSNVEFPLPVIGSDVNAVKSQLALKEDCLKEQSEQKLGPFNPESLRLQTYPLPLATHEEVIKDKDLFMDTLGKFHAALGMKMTSPRMGGTSLDLHILYREVTFRGGLQQVIKERMWKDVKDAFNFPPTATNASFVLRKYYTNLLHHYEQVYFFRVQGLLVPPPVPLPAPSPVSQPVDNGVTPASVEDLSSRKRARGSAEVDFAAAVGQNVSGAIDGKFEHGYLVTVVVGTEKLSGVLYSVPSEGCLPQFGTIHNAAMMGPVSMEIDSQEFVKARKTYKKRDPNAPKLNRSGYNFFFKEQRARLKPLYPNQDKEISRLIGDMWNKLTDMQKKPYQEQGLRDKERYKREYEAYQNQLRGQAEHSNPGATPAQDEDVLTNSRNVEFNGAAFVPSHFSMSYEGTSQAAQ